MLLLLSFMFLSNVEAGRECVFDSDTLYELESMNQLLESGEPRKSYNKLVRNPTVFVNCFDLDPEFYATILRQDTYKKTGQVLLVTGNHALYGGLMWILFDRVPAIGLIVGLATFYEPLYVSMVPFAFPSMRYMDRWKFRRKLIQSDGFDTFENLKIRDMPKFSDRDYLDDRLEISTRVDNAIKLNAALEGLERNIAPVLATSKKLQKHTIQSTKDYKYPTQKAVWTMKSSPADRQYEPEIKQLNHNIQAALNSVNVTSCLSLKSRSKKNYKSEFEFKIKLKNKLYIDHQSYTSRDKTSEYRCFLKKNKTERYRHS